MPRLQPAASKASTATPSVAMPAHLPAVAPKPSSQRPFSPVLLGDPNGTRTRVFAVKGRRPRPLDDGAGEGGSPVRRGPFQRQASAASSRCISAALPPFHSSRLIAPASHQRVSPARREQRLAKRAAGAAEGDPLEALAVVAGSDPADMAVADDPGLEQPHRPGGDARARPAGAIGSGRVERIAERARDPARARAAGRAAMRLSPRDFSTSAREPRVDEGAERLRARPAAGSAPPPSHGRRPRPAGRCPWRRAPPRRDRRPRSTGPTLCRCRPRFRQ